jgi:hypothetical protein
LLFEEVHEPTQEVSAVDTEFYKWGNPIYVQELDWGITLSKYEFCWVEIAFGNFSARDCYEKYLSSVRDGQTFLKKVL